MPIQVVCAKCGHVAHFADNDAGLAVSCLSCRKTLRVPVPAKAVISTPESSLTPTLPPLFAQQPKPVTTPAAQPIIVKPFPQAATPKPPNNAPHPSTSPSPHPQPSSPAGKKGYLAPILIGLVTCVGLILLVIKINSTVSNPAQTAATLPTTTTAPTSQPAPMVAEVPTPAPAITTPAPIAFAPAPIGLVGLNSLEMRGAIAIDAYDSSTGVYDSDAKETAALYSNGRITMNGDLKLRGDLHPGPGIAFPPNKHSKITGVTTPIDKPLAVPPVDVVNLSAQATQTPDLPAGVLTNKNLVITGKRSVAIPAGVYDLNDLTINAKCTLHCDGPVTLLIRGRATIEGTLETHQNRPRNLSLQIVSKGTVVLAPSGDLYATLYAPDADVYFTGKGDFYGSIVGRTLGLTGRRSFHVDRSLAKP